MSNNDQTPSPFSQPKLDQAQVKEMGLLLANVAREFSNWDIEVLHGEEAVPKAEVTARFASQTDKLEFLAVQTATRTLLSRTTEIEFQFRISNSRPGDAEIHLGHTGNFSRTGIRHKIKRGDHTTRGLIERLVEDKPFKAAFMPLDSKHFYLIQNEAGWTVKTGQMGAAWLAIKFPPTKRYIPMGEAQIHSLIQTFKRLSRIFTES
ncbi:MAG: DUF3156 family protein [Chloroflexota bacterium]